MKTGKSISQLAAEIERQSNAKRDMIATTDVISMQSNNGALALRVGSDEFGITELAHDQIGNYTRIPGQYYDRMRKEMPRLLADNVNAWMHNGIPEKRLIRTMDTITRAWLSDAYRPLENIDLAEAVLPVFADLKLEVISCEITERRLYLKAVDQRINADIPGGGRMGDGSHHIFDTCVPAIVISNSEVGSGALSIETAIWTRACTNMAVFSQDSMKRRHVGARHELAAGENVAALLSDATRAATDKALWMQVRDVAKGAFNEMRFRDRIAKITETTTQKIAGDPVQSVNFTAKRFGLTEGEQKSVLRHLIEGADLSRYGMFNAITRTAEDVESYDRASEIERMGGLIIDLPASEWKRISLAEGDPQRMAA
jgi:hypothetical protein